MIPPIPKNLQIQKEVCDKMNLKWRMIDTYSNCLTEVSNGEKSFLSGTYKIGLYPLNSKFAASLVTDKAWTYTYLKQKEYQVPEGEYFFLSEENRELRGDGKELEDAFKFAKKFKYPLFVKPNSGSLGILADIVHNEDELRKHLSTIEERNDIAILQEIIDKPEYRIFTVDGEVKFLYQRESPSVIGDGKKSINDLIIEKNKKVERERLKFDLGAPFLVEQLKLFKMDLNTILRPREKFRIARKSNIAAGGEIVNYQENISSSVSEWVENLMKKIPLRVCGIDIFTDEINDPQTYTIIELNHSPSLAGIYEFGKVSKAYEILEEIYTKYFEYG